MFRGRKVRRVAKEIGEMCMLALFALCLNVIYKIF